MNTVLTVAGVLSLIGTVMLTGGPELIAWRQHTHQFNPTGMGVIGSVLIIIGTIADRPVLHAPGTGFVLTGMILVGWAVFAVADQQKMSGIPIKGLQTLGVYLTTGAFMFLLPMSAISSFIGLVIGMK